MKYKKDSSKLFRATLAAAVTTGALVATVPTFTEASTLELVDLEEEQDYYEAVKILLERGIITGYPDLTYKPYESVTRGQAAKILAHFLELDLDNVVNPNFTDLKETDEYYSAIAALAERDIIQGFSDGTFRQESTLTRSQMAKMISVGFELDLEHSSIATHNFVDVEEEDEFSIYVKALTNYEITKGILPHLFGPGEQVTRGQMASFVTRGEEALAIPSVAGEIVDLVENKLVLSSGTYYIPEILEPIFNEENLPALLGATIDLEKKGKVLESINTLELTKNHEEAIILDGNGTEITNNLTVTGNSYKLENLVVEGNLEIYANDVHVNNVVVEGTANLLTEEDADPVAAPTITLEDSTFKELVVDQQDVTVHLKDNPTVENLVVKADARLNADREHALSAVTLSDAAKRLTIANLFIEELVTEGEESVTIDGPGRIELLKVYSNAGVFIDLLGAVDTLEVHLADAKATIGRKTIVGHLRLPLHKEVRDIITNFEEVRKQIEMIDNESNTDW